MRFGFAAALEAGADFVAAVVPEEDLRGGEDVVAGVEVAQERGGGETACAEVVDEIDEGVELVLVERDFDEVRYGLFGGGCVAEQESFRLRTGDAVGEGFAGLDAVTVTDGGDAGGVLVDG